MSNKEEINAAEEFDRVDGERGASSVGSTRKPTPPGSRLFLIVVLAAVIGAGSFVTWKAMSIMDLSDTEEPVEPRYSLNRAGADWKPKTPPLYEPVTDNNKQENTEPLKVEQSTFVENQTQQDSQEPTPAELIRMRRLAPDLGASPTGSQQTQAQQVSNNANENTDGPLAKSLQPTRMNMAKASVLQNRDLLLTQGAMIDCQLETRLISTVPGMMVCYTTRDTYSTNNKVVLIDSGSKVVGQYQGGMMQGQARIFGLWTRVETPKGVVVNLDSPGAGALGEGGMGGYVDRHFWERFGGAIMLSVIGDIGTFASNKANSGNSDRITFENTSEGAESMAAEALRHSIDIPPTLYKNQGERIQIFVARDLDFSEVYKLERN